MIMNNRRVEKWKMNVNVMSIMIVATVEEMNVDVHIAFLAMLVKNV